METHPSILVWEIHVQRSLAGWQATFRGFPKEPDTTEQLNKNNNTNSQLSMQTLSGDIWDLVLCPGTEPRTPAFGAQSLSHQTTREILVPAFSHRNTLFLPCLIITSLLCSWSLLGFPQVKYKFWSFITSYVNLGKTQPPMATISSLVKIIIVATTCGRLITHQ